MLEFGLERCFEHDRFAALALQLDIGDEPVERQKIKASGELFPLLRGGLDSLPERLRSEPRERDEPGKFRQCVGHFAQF